MKTEQIHSLTASFEAHARQTESGVEFWLARDLQQLLGYSKWDNFLNVVTKAKTACEVSGHHADDHFADVGKTIQMPKSATKEEPIRFRWFLDSTASEEIITMSKAAELAGKSYNEVIEDMSFI